MSTGDQPAAAPLGNPLEFEALLTDLSSRFINLPPGDVDREIEDALRRVCEMLELDFAVMWQWSATVPGLIAPTHAYPAQAGEPRSQAGEYPWTVQQVLAGRTITIASLEALPPEAAVDRESARLVGIKSNLTIPLAAGGEPPVGAVAFNMLRAERDWPDRLVNRLQLVAQVFTNALARRRHEVQLRESGARLAAGADLAGLGFYEIDYEHGAVFLDDRFRAVCGVPPDIGSGMDALEFWIAHLHHDDRRRVLELRQELHDAKVDQLSAEYRYLHPSEGEQWIHHLARVSLRDAAGRVLRTYGVLRNVTERNRVEEELRDLSSRLIQAHEEERALLARELHDDVTQRLAVLAIDTGRAEAAAGDDAQARAMRALREDLVRVSEDIHTLAYQLHPSVLEELGLAEALRTDCERRQRRNPFNLTIDLEPLPGVVPKDVALCLFRVAQEAMNNVVRHAGARAVSVKLRRMDGGLVLAVHDDGAGFEPDRLGKGRSLGFASMRERVRLVNGTVDIESAPGYGTTVVAWAPVAGVSA